MEFPVAARPRVCPAQTVRMKPVPHNTNRNQIDDESSLEKGRVFTSQDSVPDELEPTPVIYPGVQVVDPLTDVRWPNFIAGHAGATVFHSVAWLRSLKETYGYDAKLYTTTSPKIALQ